MPHAHLAAQRKNRRRSWWGVAVCAAVVLAIGDGLLVSAYSRVPKLTPLQERRGITTAIGHHSFAPPLLRQYYGDDEIPHWSISGATVITDDYVRLTADRQSQTGHLWNTEPLDMDAFEVVVGFRVYQPMGGIGADGFAVWVAQPPRFDGPIFGRPSAFKGFGILFDSYDNDNRRDNPMVSLVYNDGSLAKRFDPDKDFVGDTVASCVYDYRAVAEPGMATMRMVYLKGTLQVFLSRDNEATETECFRVTNLPMPADKAHLALSAQTGGVTEVHDIVFVHLSPLAEATYDHDVHQTVLPAHELHDAQLYNNDAMNNRPSVVESGVANSPTTTPQHQEQQVPQQMQQAPQHQEQQVPQQMQQAPQHQEQQVPQQMQQAPQHQEQQVPQQMQQAPQHQEQQVPQQMHQAPQHQEQQVPQQMHQAPQHQEQQSQVPTQASASAAATERQRIEELERKLAELQARDTRRVADRVEEEEAEYGLGNSDGSPRRVRRARTHHQNRAEGDD
ncbi:hypothetical protein CUR178_07775 [Leishmania enriettii]|uniref:L-type lectin-like domain-containing protein n=1 Tax=Leishmania enriettii TaxID=5663 RepID=A0A836KQ32_LEIEN|nr:hypothetical protein CUR178_07775 [Leishmania enriettii]